MSVSGIDVRQDTACRKRPLPTLRAMVCHVMREEGYSLSEIACEVKKDHATVVHNLKMIDNIETYSPKIWEVEVYRKFKDIVQLKKI